MHSTIKFYIILLLSEDQISQSNGSLMRVYPLALLKDDIIDKKGWVLHSIYCAFMVLKFYNFSEAMAWIINQRGCDSDTLAVISGHCWELF